MKSTKAMTILVIFLLMSVVFMRNPVHAQEISNLKSNTPTQGTNSASMDDLVAVAKRTHTKEAWLAVLYRDIEDDPSPDGGSGNIFPAIYFIAAGIVGVVAVFIIYKGRRKNDAA